MRPLAAGGERLGEGAAAARRRLPAAAPLRALGTPSPLRAVQKARQPRAWGWAWGRSGRCACPLSARGAKGGGAAAKPQTNSKMQNIQHLAFPCGPPPQYYPSPSQLKFGVLMGVRCSMRGMTECTRGRQTAIYKEDNDTHTLRRPPRRLPLCHRRDGAHSHPRPPAAAAGATPSRRTAGSSHAPDAPAAGAARPAAPPLPSPGAAAAAVAAPPAGGAPSRCCPRGAPQRLHALTPMHRSSACASALVAPPRQPLLAALPAAGGCREVQRVSQGGPRTAPAPDSTRARRRRARPSAGGAGGARCKEARLGAALRAY